MKEEKSLATLLTRFMSAAETGDARLASLVNTQVGITSFLHRSTVRNWRNGSSKSVKDWRQLAAIAAALNLDREDTDQLLFAGSCPPVDTLKKMANDDDQSFLTPWKGEQATVAPLQPQQSSPSEPDEFETNISVPSTSDELKASITASSFPIPTKSKKSAVSRLLKIAVPAVLALGVLVGAIRWMGGAETTESFTANSSQIETDGSFTFYFDEVGTKWDYTLKSWNSTAEPLNTDRAFQGEQVLNVKLSEYGGVSFFRPEPIDTEPYNLLQFHIRRADATQENISLSILLDDDSDFTNGEIGRTVVNNYLEGNITAEAWHKVEIPLTAFSPRPFMMSQLAIQGTDPGGTPRFWVDQVQLVANVTDTEETETAEPLMIYSDQTRMHWDFTNTSWDVTAESLQTGLAITGNHVLDVKLGVYAGLSFSHEQSVSTEPYSFLQLYVRPIQSDDISLTIMLDDDDDLNNGEVGRTMIHNYLDEEMMVDEWREVKIPLNAFSPEPFTISRLVIHSPANGATPHFWVDQIQLVKD